MKSHKDSNHVNQTAVTHRDSETTVTHKDLEKNPTITHENRKNDLILIMTPEKQDKTLELSKH